MAISRFAESDPATGFLAWDGVTSRFAEWRPYQNAKTGKSGWISEGGQVRYDDPRAKEQATAEARSTAQQHVANALARPETVRDEHIPAIHEHLKTLTRDQVKEFARSLRLKLGGKKAELADRIKAQITGDTAPKIGSALETGGPVTSRRDLPGGNQAAPPPAPRRPRAPRRPPVDRNGPTAAPKVPKDIEFTGMRSQGVKRRMADLFGPSARPAILAAAANAGDGARVKVEDAGSNLLVETNGDGYYASRYFGRDADDQLYVKNVYFRINFENDPANPGPPPGWKPTNPNVNGTELLTNQIRALGKLGVKKIKTHAARSDSTNPNRGMNGYYTWPRLGYDSKLDEQHYTALPPDLKAQVDANPVGSKHARSVLSLMDSEAGRQWWKRNGSDLYEAEFDLTPGSLSMRTLTAYRQQRTAGAG